jgi:serine protease
MTVLRNRTQVRRREFCCALMLAFFASASAVTPTDTYFAAPPGSPAGFDGYQWPLHSGWMNFVEAWDYTPGSARIAISDGGTSIDSNLHSEFYLPYFGSWDFSSRTEQVCPLTQFFGNGCGIQPFGAPPVPWPVFIENVAVPRHYFFGQYGDIDLSRQQGTVVSGEVYIPATQSWQTGPTLDFHDVAVVSDRITGQVVHGTHVYSIIKAEHNNPPVSGVGGIAGACPGCQVLGARVNTQSPDGGLSWNAGVFTPIASLRWMINGGAQIVSASFGFDNTGLAACNPTTFVPGESDFCELLRLAKSRDVVFVAAAGNDMANVDFPAHDPMAIAVGGVDIQKRLWDDRLFGFQYSEGDLSNGCPAQYNNSVSTTFECGSNTGPSLDFVTPSRRILGLVPPGKSFGGISPICGDDNFGGLNDGVGRCTGTSMSAPLLAAAAGLVRSINPLLQRDAVYETLKRSADGNQVFSNRGWGMPNAGSAVKLTLGRSGNSQVQNRLTPMFVMKTTGDRLYTVAPQLAVAAYQGHFAARPYAARNPSEFFNGVGLEHGATYRNPQTEANPVRLGSSNYIYPGLESGYFARASFYVFSGSIPMFGVKMKRMDRLLSVATCDVRENTFDFTRRCPALNGSESLELRTFHNDGIEGYLLSTCPTQFGDCTNFADPSVPQAVYLRYSATDKSFALLLGSQLTEPQFSTYLPLGPRQPAATAPLGYAFKNIDTDSDGLIDGMERVLGSNRLIADTDCDGASDGVEYPTLTLQGVGQDPMSGPCAVTGLVDE